MGLFNHENLQVSCHKDKKTCRFIKGFRKLICSISESKRTLKGRLIIAFSDLSKDQLFSAHAKEREATYSSLYRLKRRREGLAPVSCFSNEDRISGHKAATIRIRCSRFSKSYALSRLTNSANSSR